MPSINQWEYYSYKDKFHALKYEVAISFHAPRIIWVNGPYKGAVSDITIARDKLIPALDNGELCLADKGYVGEAQHILCPYKPPRNDYEHQVNYAINKKRQEIERINKRIKNFDCFSQEWRCQDYNFHEKCFVSVCKIVNILLEDEPLCQ